MKKVTVFGGGTGNFVVLSGLKQKPVDLAAVVTMMDSGGSTGRLRDQLGVLPPGDLRQCLVALSEAPLFWRQLFLYRFDKGDLAGHNFGNIFISALEKVTGDYDQVLKTASYILKIKGGVIPVTTHKTQLVVQYENGRLIKGEGKIDANVSESSRVKSVYLEPMVKANTAVIRRIIDSDYLVIGPGDLYTSIIPIFLVKGVKEAIKGAKAKIIYIVNLMTKSGQTRNYTATDHISDLEKYLGRFPNIVIINNGKIPKFILEWYLTHHEKLVFDDLDRKDFKGEIIRDDLVVKQVIVKDKSDRLSRSILRHDSDKLAKIIYRQIL